MTVFQLSLEIDFAINIPSIARFLACCWRFFKKELQTTFCIIFQYNLSISNISFDNVMQ